MFFPSLSKRVLLFFLVFGLSTLSILAQEVPDLQVFNASRLDYNKNGMLILGSWAVGNMVWGGIGASRQTGSSKAFHQMNLYWNTVNLAIAGFGYWQATQEVPDSNFWASLEAQQGIEKILLVNAGLDLAYMAGGMYLKERGLRKEKDQWVGFGNSIVLQGAFLLLFDSVLYGVHHAHAKNLPEIFQHLHLSPTGFSLLFYLP